MSCLFPWNLAAKTTWKQAVALGNYFDSYIDIMRVRLQPRSENNKEADGETLNYFESYIEAMGVQSRPKHRVPGSAMTFTLHWQ